MVPALACVLALNSFTNAMMLMPCGPSAVPTGGAGVAWAAGICSLTKAIAFLAITTPLSNARRTRRAVLPRFVSRRCGGRRERSVASQLQIIQLDAGGPTEQAHRHANLSFVCVDLFHCSAEVAERTLGDLDRLSDHERNLFLGLFRFRLVRDA